MGAASQRMAVPHVNAAHARSPEAAYQRMVRPAPDAPARRRTTCVDDPRRAADAQQAAEASRSPRCGQEAERPAGARPPGTRPAGGAL